MALVHFYEKPGCINNTRQKALLQAAGHELDVQNLLTTPWTAEDLRAYFGDRPVPDWFNRSAPTVKSGEVVPEHLDAAQALALMVAHPLLIRRPLLQVGDRREVGFDLTQIEQWIGLTPISPQQQDIQESLTRHDLQTCPRQSQSPCSSSSL